MNKAMLTGRLTKDPTIKYSSEMCIARFTLAVNRRGSKQEEKADFISCVAFGKTGEFCEKYARKGMKFDIVGRIQTGSYQKDNQTIYTTDIVVEDMEFGESKAASQETKPEPKEEEFMSVPDDDLEGLPFN